MDDDSWVVRCVCIVAMIGILIGMWYVCVSNMRDVVLNMPEYSSESNLYTLKIPVSDTKQLALKVPKDYSVVHTDNETYWRLDENMMIYVTNVIQHDNNVDLLGTNTYSDSHNIYYDCLDKTITIQCCKVLQYLFSKYLQDSEVIDW